MTHATEESMPEKGPGVPQNRRWRVWVAGEPFAQPRPRAAFDWRSRAPLTGPVAVTIECVMPRPGTLRKTKPNPTRPHTAKPDADNLAKPILDAPTGLVFANESQVYDLRVMKRVAAGGEQPGAWIEIQWEPV